MSETPVPAQPPRILIVDDVADNREVLARRFVRRGYEIIHAEGGVRALEIVAEGGVDAVLLDVMMPDINGFDVLTTLRKTYTSVQLPIIMVTAVAESRDVVKGLELGANDYITKPVDFAVALARVEAQVGRRRAEMELVEANATLHEKVVELRDAVLRAEAATRAKSEFLANMSHEIRTPLNGVLGLTGVLAQSSLDERQRELVGIITSSAGLLDRLLSDVLDMARAESGRLEMRPEPTVLAPLVRQVAGLIEPNARAKGLSFDVHLAPEAAGALEVDAVRLSQILTNLLSNAVKFTASGGVTLEVTDLGGRRRFTVRDTGIGFGPEAKARLFERFEQADPSITRQFGGAGLGLSISRELAELMGGSLHGEGEPGRGAVFTLEIPAQAAARAA